MALGWAKTPAAHMSHDASVQSSRELPADRVTLTLATPLCRVEGFLTADTAEHLLNRAVDTSND